MTSSSRPLWAAQDDGELIAHAGRIPKAAVKGASIALFVLAILSATARTSIRLMQKRRLYADDGFLLVAVVFLVASMALLWQQLDEMFVAEALVTNTAISVLFTSSNWMDQLFWFLKISDAFLVLSWTSVMAVKFSFLFFFRNLIARVRGMKLYWWVVFSISIAVWIFGCGAVFAPCPYFDLRSLSCSQGPEYGVAVAYSAAIIALDILVDLLILAMPIHLIAQIRIKRRQKAALAASLCLSVLIVLTSIVCIAGIRAPAAGSDAIDVTWELFWQAAEANVSVVVVSLVAFRSLFVAHASRHQRSPPQQPSPPQPNTPDTEQRRRKMLWRKKLRDADGGTTWNDSSTAGTDGGPHAVGPPAVTRPAAVVGSSRFRLPGWRGLPDIPSARLSGVLTRFGPGSQRLSGPPSNIMRSHASWDANMDQDLEKGSTVAESEEGLDQSKERRSTDVALLPISMYISAGGGAMSRQVATLPYEPSPAELEAVYIVDENDSPLERASRSASELDLPIQRPAA